MYAQTDPQWAEKELGESGLKMKNFGCTITAVAQAFTLAGYSHVTPGFLLDRMNEVGGFTDKNHQSGAGLILWAKLTEALNGISFGFSLDGSLPYKVIQGNWNGSIHWVLKLQTADRVLLINPYNGRENISGFETTGRVRSFDIPAPSAPVVPEAPLEPAQPEVPSAPVDETAGDPDVNGDTLYTVVEGDTLSEIVARHYKLSGWAKIEKQMTKVAKYNSIENVDLIRPGQVIKLMPAS